MRELVFSDACLSATCKERGAKLEAVSNCAAGIAALVAEEICEATLRTSKEFYELVLSDGTSIHDILVDAIATREYRESAIFLQTISTKAPLMSDLSAEVKEAVYGVEVMVPEGDTSMALALCVATDSIAAGIALAPTWSCNPLLLTVSRLLSDGSTVLDNCTCDHVVGPRSASEIIDKEREEHRQRIPKDKFWAERIWLFPNLRFGLDVEEQMQRITSTIYVQTLERLTELDNTAAEWKANSDISPRYRSRVTPESEATMNMYGESRKFRSSTGNTRVFELHARLQGGHRLHFAEDRAARNLEIGYVGKHLPTVTG